jgi:hypothetical protein
MMNLQSTAGEEFISKLLYSRNVMHIAHLRTKGYAEHKALNEYYDGILDLADGLAETLMGSTGMTFSLKIPAAEYMPPVPHLNQMKSYIEATRAQVSSESHIQNQIDEIVSLISKTLYLLTLS